MDNKEVVLKYLKEKSNEEDVISFLQEQKRVIANRPGLLDDSDFSLMIKLAKSSKGKIKYHAIIILSNIEFCMKAKNFYDLCRIAAESSKDKDGHVRQASVILAKNINAWMLILPLITKLQNTHKEEINLFYESFKNLFYKLHFLFYNESEQNVRESILKSLRIMLPKFSDMAKFWKDEEERGMVNKIKDEINKR